VHKITSTGYDSVTSAEFNLNDFQLGEPQLTDAFIFSESYSGPNTVHSSCCEFVACVTTASGGSTACHFNIIMRENYGDPYLK
jgi:hypothetical protein